MKRAGAPVGVGTCFAYDGEIVQIVEMHSVDDIPEVLTKDLHTETVRRFAFALRLSSPKT